MHKLIVLLWFSVAILSLQAQKYVFENYSVDEGLAQSQVRSLFQDSRGDLWIGTVGGVSRFDGITFENFNSSSGLIQNQVNAILETAEGDIILGSQGGITVFNGRDFTNHQFENTYAMTNEIIASGDSLIIATSKGLFSFNGNRITPVISPLNAENSNIKTIKPVNHGVLLLTGKGLYLWQQDSFEELFNAEAIALQLNQPDCEFMDVALTSKNEIYITTSRRGLLHIHEKTITVISEEDGLASTVCSRISLDKNEQPLISTIKGFSHLKSFETVSFNQLNGLEFEDVRVVIEDRNGTLWAGTNGGGLFKFAGYAITYFDKDAGLSSDAIMNIGRMPTGEMLYCTYDAGACLAGAQEWIYFSESDLTNSRVWTHTTDSGGVTYLGTSGGIDVLENNVITRQITTEDGLSYRKITSLYTDSKNQVWIGTSRGIDKLSNGEITNFPNFNGSRIRDILETKSGELYFCSRQGVWKKEGESFILEPFSEQLKTPLVYCIEELNDQLVIGTTEGLFLANDSLLEKINISDNFSANVINFLHKDHLENLWVGTNFGLYRLDQNLEVTPFTKQDGLTNLETNLNSVYSDEKALWFGTSTALHRIDFTELNKKYAQDPPEVKLNELKLNLEHTDWTQFTTSFMKASPVPNSPKLGHKNNNFQFIFSTNTLDEPEKIVYQYMLEGYDNNWLPVTQSNVATYTNLPFQTFNFKVRAKRSSQAWGDPFVYALVVKPPFWRTWWFILFSFLLISFIAYSIFQYRRKNLITQLEKEKFELKSKMLSLEQQSLNSSMNRHFIFNALNSIQYYINRQDRLAANKYLSSFAKLIRKNLDSSQVNFTSLSDELERLELYLEIENMRFKDKFEYHISVSDAIDAEATQIPSMLLQPYLENSIWHGILPQEKKGIINLDISKNPIGQMEIRIKDNGIGINTSQALKNGKANHISKGMKITNGRIQLLQNLTHQKVILIGPFELKNEAGEVEGTQVTIKLPQQYNKEQIA